MKRVVPWLTCLSLVVLSASCGNEQPELPPVDSMELPDFFDNNGSALSSADQSTANIRLAATAVVAVTVGVRLLLALPAFTFAAVVKTRPEADGETWIWTKSFPLWGVEGRLEGELQGGTLDLAMFIDGQREGNNLDNFEWYSGSHQRGEGQWLLNWPEVEGAVLTIDWERAADDDKRIAFTNTHQGGEGEGDSITYELKGTTASMTIVDAYFAAIDDRREFRVEWDVEAGSGQYTDVDNVDHCWNALDDGQIDIPCE